MPKNKLYATINSQKSETLLILILILSGAIAFALNIFNFPYYENDEGTYMSQAWAVFKLGQLAPYTYWYDHAPLGWMQMGLWSTLTGGFFTFGFGINSGRALTIIIQIINILLVYTITKTFTQSKIFAFIAGVIFAYSPLGILLQRRILLDNLAILWTLVSMQIMLIYNNKLITILYAGLALGIAILSKESVVFFAPVFLYFIYKTVHIHHRLHAVILWSVIIGSLIGLYFTYALIKGEFFPPGFFPWDNRQHVSLLQTLTFQAGRGGGNIFDFQTSDFWTKIRTTWTENDPLLVYAGFFAVFANLIIGIRNLYARLLSLAALSFTAFLGRGGIVLDFYIIPLLPFLVFNLVYLVWLLYQYFCYLFRRSSLLVFIRLIPVFMLVTFLSQFLTLKDAIGTEDFSLYTSNQTKAQIEAVDWIHQKLKPEDVILFDNHAFLDLKARPDQVFPNAHWYIKIDTDQEITQKIGADYRNIDYIAFTPQVEADVKNFSSGLPIVEQAYKNAREIHTFYSDRWIVRILGSMQPKRVTTSAYRSLINKFTDGEKITWYKVSYNNYVYLLQIMIAKDQRQDFNRMLEHFKSNYNFNEQKNTDLAKILLFAYQKWSDPDLRNQALAYIQNERQDLKTWEGYTLPFKSTTKTNAVISLTKLDVAAYHLFYNATNDPIWQKTRIDAYRVIDFCLKQTKSKLPASTCDLEQYANQPLNAKFYFPVFDPNTSKIYQNIGHDLVWFNSTQAKDFLDNYNFLTEEWSQSYRLSDTYQTDTKSLSDGESVQIYQAILPIVQYYNPPKAQELYDIKFKDQFKEDQIQTWWGTDPDNLDTILHSIYATLYFGNLLPNP